MHKEKGRKELTAYAQRDLAQVSGQYCLQAL